MADRYNNINNTSPYVSALKNEDKKIPRSDFDYGRSHHGNMNIGTLEILDCFPTLPNSDYTIAMDLLLKVRVALNKRIMTGQRCFVHAWYMSYNDLWEAAQNHIDHGRSGLLDIKKPYTDGYLYNNNDVARDIFTPNSVYNQLGVPVRRQNSLPKIYSYVPVGAAESSFSTLIQNFTVKSNVLPAAMYQRIYLDKYASKNLLQNNKDIYPDNAEKSRLPYNATKVDFLQTTSGSVTSSSWSSSNSDPNGDSFIMNNFRCLLGLKRYRQKKGDYFVTSSPFADLLRGDAPTIDLTNVISNIDFSEVIRSTYTPAVTSNHSVVLDTESGQPTFTFPFFSDQSTSEGLTAALISTLNKAKVNSSIQTQVTANMLRTVIALTLIKERNALTNGDYNEMVKAQFGYSPSVDDFSAKYIGGFYQDITFSDVTQTTPTSDYPLGYQSGQAMSANSGFIGKFHSSDFGYIMILASIVPDEIYNQGVPRFLGELSADEEYTSPILNNLPPQAIKNKEIYLSNDDSVNEDVFSYTQRYEHLRHRENYASGFVGLGSSVSLEDKDYIQHKVLQSSPQFNAKFVSLCPDNVDMSIYAVQNEPPYIFTAISKVDKIEPLPYDSIPADFGFAFA